MVCRDVYRPVPAGTAAEFDVRRSADQEKAAGGHRHFAGADCTARCDQYFLRPGAGLVDGSQNRQQIYPAPAGVFYSVLSRDAVSHGLLFEGLPRQMRKAVELGASRIVPVLTDRCVSRPDEKSFAKKLSRYQKISESASKQSGRGIIPEITGILNVKQAAEELSKCDIALVCYEKGGISLNDAGLEKGKSVGVFIGSEGGFEESEAQLAKECAITLGYLGERILRCETAPIAALAVLMNVTENL